MALRTNGFSGLLAVVSSMAIAAPAIAEVPFAWAQVRGGSNQATLVSAQGEARVAAMADRLYPGESINTSARAWAEMVFNDGSLARAGEQTTLNFWPNTRQLRLTKGTVAVFVPPSQGRTTLETPNARVGLNSTGVVVRYVPTRGLTLVMALADSPAGPVSITTGKLERETALYAGQMAFVSEDTVQIVEFDLLEFYQTSALMAGLQLDNLAYRPGDNEPLALLRSILGAALSRQATFEGNEAILDPTAIRDFIPESGNQASEGDTDTPVDPTEGLRPSNAAPAGVNGPLPETAPSPADDQGVGPQPETVQTATPPSN